MVEYVLVIGFMLVISAIIIGTVALRRADRALGLTTWTDRGTEIRISLLKEWLGLRETGRVIQLGPDKWYWLLVDEAAIEMDQLDQIINRDGNIILTGAIKLVEGADRIKGIAIVKNFGKGDWNNVPVEDI